MQSASALEQALERSDARYREIFERSAAGNYITAVDGTILACNRTFARLLGFSSREHAMSTNARTLYRDPLNREQFLKLIAEAGQAEGYETTLLHVNGTSLPVLEHAIARFNPAGELVEVHGYVIDLTSQKQAEAALHESVAQLRQAQRMEAMGRLAGGIAHDFNNLLTAILGFSDLLLQEATLDARARADVEQIHRSGTSAVSLTRQLLAFSRKQVLKPTTLNLNQVVTDVATMLRRVLGEDVSLTTAVAAEDACVVADRGQLEQVLMNLAVNARDAMPGGGVLHILVKAESSHVVLEVGDTGCGMAPDLLPQIFEPFFTTKKVGEGTGLGLATVYGIVTQSGGSIEVASEPGRGTVFSVRLPRFRPVAPPVAPPTGARPLRGHETVLVVEDEAAVRSLVRAALERQGYTVLMAEDGEAAIRVLERRSPPIDLVVSDVVMPHMSGPDILSRAGALQPDLKMLLMSGYWLQGGTRTPAIPPRIRLLQKPFTPLQLVTMVREVLDAPAFAPGTV